MSSRGSIITSQIRSILEANGYARLIGALTIGAIHLEIDEVWIGREGTLDLAIMYPRPTSLADESKIYWEVQRIVRALDAAGSQRTITAILIGPSDLSGFELRKWESELQSLARILHVDGHLPTERLLAPLQRLVLPTIDEWSSDGAGLLEKVPTRGRRASELRALVAAAEDGPRSVEACYFSWIEQAFASKEGTN